MADTFSDLSEKEKAAGSKCAQIITAAARKIEAYLIAHPLEFKQLSLDETDLILLEYSGPRRGRKGQRGGSMPRAAGRSSEYAQPSATAKADMARIKRETPAGVLPGIAGYYGGQFAGSIAMLPLLNTAMYESKIGSFRSSQALITVAASVGVLTSLVVGNRIWRGLSERGKEYTKAEIREIKRQHASGRKSVYEGPRLWT